MNLTEINKIILGQDDKYNSLTIPEKLPDIKDILIYIKDNSFGLWNSNSLVLTQSYTEFYEANPMLESFITDYAFEKSVDKKFILKEFFFSMLCECYIPGVPSELVAIMILTRRTVETPNRMIAALDKVRLNPFITKRFHSDNLILKKLMDTIWGYDTHLVTENLPMVENKGIVEIYIPSLNDILLCNPNIKDLLPSVEDIQNLDYSKEKGITIGKDGIPLRTLIQCYGITEDDLDLRKVFFSNGL